MVKYKLANILLEMTPTAMNVPTLYCRKTAPLLQVDNGDAWKLLGPGSFDFTTFYNALSTMKWQRYTVASSFFLHIEIRGNACTLTQTAADSFSWESIVRHRTATKIEASQDWQTVDVELDVQRTDVLNAFLIEANGAVEIRNAYYYAKVPQDAIRNVELALATTTFKKEDYILKNISLIKHGVIESNEPVAQHFNLHVIDNGRTLDVAQLTSSRIAVHPNPNAGGSGGFARGMIEAMEQTPKATHVLLMDDDVEVSPESIIRTFNLLSLANEEYREAFVSGAMMSLEQPALRTEDLGFFTFNGNFRPLKPEAHMDVLHDVVASETFITPSDIKEYADTAQQYAGWWYCVIPMATIEKHGLPLPLFVRSDDAEYALRCKPKFITMNGICVWHNSFFFKYSAAVERYQVSRNTLISQFTSDIAPMSDFTKEIYHEVQLDLKKFNYDDAALAVKGFEDFLRGPTFIEQPVAEGRFMEANKEREKLVPLEDLYDEALKLGIDLSTLSAEEATRDYPRDMKKRVKDYFSFNGQRVRNDKVRSGKVAVIDAAGWVYPAGKIRDVDTIIAIDLPNRKGVIRHLDHDRFNSIWKRYLSAKKEYRKNKDRLKMEYGSAKKHLTSVSFWKHYLNIQ